MKIYDWKQTINKDELNNVVNALYNSNIIVFPTETVYGIGCDAFNDEAVKKIFEAKGRPSDNPLIVHVSNISMLKRCIKNISSIEEKLIDSFMPGPFTLILQKSEIIPHSVTAGLDTVAIRMPNNNIAKEIIESFGKPIAAPSANISGRPSGTRIADIKEELGDKVYALIDGGNTKIGLESTVVKVINNIPVILRPGAVTPEDIKNVVGRVELDKHILAEVSTNEVVESPGMKHKHYSPETKCILINIENERKKIEKINSMLKDNVAFVGFEKNRKKINSNNFYSMGETVEDASQNIFSLLRKIDKLDYDLIIIEGVKAQGLGIALMNRLIRTCAYNVIEN